MTIEQRLARLEALRDIEALIGALARAFDAGPSAEQLRPLFAEDAEFVIDRYGRFAGRDAIADGVAGNAERGFRWTLHYLVSPRIELSADATSADMDFMLWEVATASSDRAYLIGGRYLAEVARTGEGWAFRRLELQADLISHYAPGWTGKPATLADA